MNAIAAAAVLSPNPALACGKTGHRVVAAIAQEHLSWRARAGVRRIFGVETLAEFLTVPVARRIRQERGPAAILSANNVIANIDDLDEIAAAIRRQFGKSAATTSTPTAPSKTNSGSSGTPYRSASRTYR